VIEPFDEVRRTGLLRYVVLRANVEGKVLVALVTGRESWPEAESLARELAAACPTVLALSTTSTARAETPSSARPSAFFSAPHSSKTHRPSTRASGATFLCSSQSLGGRPRYDDIAAAAARLGSIGRVVDAYAGAGGIALSLAPLARGVVAIEENSAACATAQAFSPSVKLGHRERINLIAGDVADHLARVGTADLVVLNPPRKGCAQR